MLGVNWFAIVTETGESQCHQLCQPLTHINGSQKLGWRPFHKKFCKTAVEPSQAD